MFWRSISAKYIFRACENITSAVHQNSNGNHIIFVRFESAKEISISIQQMKDEVATSFSLTDSFKKVNYEYMLGDYCNFDKILLSVGIDSNMVYTTVKCGDDGWAFMRSILSATGDFFTPSGPLIYFKKGDPSFDRLLFLSTYSGSSNKDSVIVRYQLNEVSSYIVTDKSNH